MAGRQGWGAGLALMANFFTSTQERMFGQVSYAVGLSASIVDRWRSDPLPPYLNTATIPPWFEPVEVQESPRWSYELGGRVVFFEMFGAEVGFSPRVHRVYQIYRSTVSDSLYYQQQSDKTTGAPYGRLMYFLHLPVGRPRRLPIALGLGFNATVGLHLFVGVKWF
jgi:hypothetical protein